MPRIQASSSDLIAGLSIAGLLLPEAVAYSGLAGLPPQAGLIGLVVGLIAYGLIGSSRFAVVSGTSSSAAVLASAVASMSLANPASRVALAAALVFIAGVYFLLVAAAKLGTVSDFISKPVLRGFGFGLATVIIIKQLPTVFAVHVQASSPLAILPQLVERYRDWNLWSLGVGAIGLALLFLFGRARRLPGALLVIAAGIAAAVYLHLQQRGVSLVGPIHFSLQIPAVPQFSRAEWLRLGEIGVALVMVLYAESCGSIRGFAVKYGDEVNANRDLVALGVANIGSGLLMGLPVGAGYSATSANESAGARSRLAGLCAAAIMVMLIAFVLPIVAWTPEAVLAAIVIHAVSHSLDPRVFRRYVVWQRDRLVVVAAIVAVLVLGVLDGLLAAIAISLVMMLRQISLAQVTQLGRLGASHDFVDRARHTDARPVPGLLILRPAQPIFFANTDRFMAQLRNLILAAAPDVRGVIISLEESYDLDGSSVEALLDLVRWIHSRGQVVTLARLKSPVQQVLQTAVADSRNATGLAMTDLSVDDAVNQTLGTTTG